MPNKIFFSLIIACYNEKDVFEESMLRIVSVLKRLQKPFEIILVEDKSKDHTAELVRAFAARNVFVRTIFHSKNKGRGASVMDGIKIARGPICGFLDIDLEVSVDYVPAAVKKIEGGFDIVTGNRTPKKSPLFRTFLHYAYVRFLMAALGLPVQDTNAGFKFFNTARIKKLLPFLHEHHWFWDTELLLKAYWAGFSIFELPVTYQKNPSKKSTVRLFSDSWHFFSKTLEYAKNRSKIQQELASLCQHSAPKP